MSTWQERQREIKNFITKQYAEGDGTVPTDAGVVEGTESSPTGPEFSSMSSQPDAQDEELSVPEPSAPAEPSCPTCGKRLKWEFKLKEYIACCPLPSAERSELMNREHRAELGNEELAEWLLIHTNASRSPYGYLAAQRLREADERTKFVIDRGALVFADLKAERDRLREALEEIRAGAATEYGGDIEYRTRDEIARIARRALEESQEEG